MWFFRALTPWVPSCTISRSRNGTSGSLRLALLSSFNTFLFSSSTSTHHCILVQPKTSQTLCVGNTMLIIVVICAKFISVIVLYRVPFLSLLFGVVYVELFSDRWSLSAIGSVVVFDYTFCCMYSLEGNILYRGATCFVYSSAPRCKSLFYRYVRFECSFVASRDIVPASRVDFMILYL